MRKIMVVIIICLAIIGCICGCIIYKVLTTNIYVGVMRPIPSIHFSQNVTEECWTLTVDYVGPAERSDYYYCDDNQYRLSNKSGTFFYAGNVSDIRNKPDIEYNITWLDNDNDYKFSVGDNFIISKRGGSSGKAERDYVFKILNKSLSSAIGEILLQ